jgi:hypothetical protein
VSRLSCEVSQNEGLLATAMFTCSTACVFWLPLLHWHLRMKQPVNWCQACGHIFHALKSGKGMKKSPGVLIVDGSHCRKFCSSVISRYKKLNNRTAENQCWKEPSRLFNQFILYIKDNFIGWLACPCSRWLETLEPFVC